MDKNKQRSDSPSRGFIRSRRRSRSRSRSRSPRPYRRARRSRSSVDDYRPRPRDYDRGYRSRSLSPFYEVAADVTSQQGVNASFKVPGVITIPTDSREHNVTIVTLVPEAKLSWFAVPSVSEKVHITVCKPFSSLEFVRDPLLFYRPTSRTRLSIHCSAVLRMFMWMAVSLLNPSSLL